MNHRIFFKVNVGLSVLALATSGYGVVPPPRVQAVEPKVAGAINNFNRWQIQTIATVAAGYPMFHPSLKMDAASRPHISYFDDGNNAIHYTRLTGGVWQDEVVDTGVGNTALVLDMAGQPHIIYFNQGLRYARYDGANWQLATVDAVGGGFSFALVLDAAERPHISYQDDNARSLNYAWFNGTTWLTETVDRGDEYGAGVESSLALDTAGRPHIIYRQEATLSSPSIKLKYAWFDGNTWQIEMVESAGVNGTPTLVLDSNNQPRIAYVHYEGTYPTGYSQVTYAWRDGGGWHRARLALGNQPPALLLDALDQPHIGYYTSNLVRYAWRDWLGWHTETVEQVADPHGQTTLAQDAAGNIFLSYSYDKNTLRYATRSSAAELALSTKGVSPANVNAGERLTYTLQLINLSALSSTTFSVVDPIPANTIYVPGSAWASSGNITESGGITWTGTISAATSLTATFVVTTSSALTLPTVITNTATLTGDPAGPLTLQAVAFVNHFPFFLPMVAKGCALC